MCADFILFFRRGKILLAFVLMLLFFLQAEKDTVGICSNVVGS